MPTHEKTLVLGAEYDEQLRVALREVLMDLGGKSLAHDWALCGSQELERFEVELPGHRLLVEAETYVGLSIAGPSALVDTVQSMVTSRIAVPR